MTTPADRTPIDTQDPGVDKPGSGATPSTGKDSKPVEGATPAPEAVPAAGGSKAAHPSSVKAEKGQPETGQPEKGQPAEAELGPATASEPPVSQTTPGDGAGPVGAAHTADDELAQALRQRDEYLSLAQRTQADFENYRKRSAREAKSAEARGVNRVVKELLPALDNLGRALSGAAEDDPLLAGVRLVYQDLVAALRRHGVEAYSPEGEAFDPAQHEAMAQQPVEGVESGTVVEVYQQGYRMDGTVIRPARVVVAA